MLKRLWAAFSGQATQKGEWSPGRGVHFGAHLGLVVLGSSSGFGPRGFGPRGPGQESGNARRAESEARRRVGGQEEKMQQLKDKAGVCRGGELDCYWVTDL